MFDPYHKWLGIPPKDQPPNHYRLLGIEMFETDADVIDAAANKQMAYIQGCATGPHIALSQKMLNEIAAARLCLLTPAKKADYDAKLKAKLPSVPLAKPVPSASGVGAITATSPAPGSPRSSPRDREPFDAVASELKARKRPPHRSKKWPVLLGGALLCVVGLVILGVYALGFFNPAKTDTRKAVVKTKAETKPKTIEAQDKPVVEKLKKIEAQDKPVVEKLKKIEAQKRSVDLLTLIDVKRDAIVGNWSFQDKTLVSPNKHGPLQRLRVPYDPPEDYDLTLVVERKQGDDIFIVGLAGGGRQFQLDVDGWPPNYVSGLELLDGKSARKDNETRHLGQVLLLNKPTQITVSVRNEGITVTADLKRIIEFKGSYKRFSPFWPPKDGILFLGTQSTFHITKMELTPIAGREQDNKGTEQKGVRITGKKVSD